MILTEKSKFPQWRTSYAMLSFFFQL